MAAPGLVVFDCDGVLVDSEPLAMRVLLESVAEKGVVLDPATAYERFLGRSLASIHASLRELYGIAFDAADQARARQRLYATFAAELQAMPGIAEALDRLDRPFCVASSSQPERIELSLGVTGLWPRFAGRAFSATMVARGKPAPDLFLHAAGTLGHDPAACVVVEDSPVGLQAAKAAGMRAIAFTGGSHAGSPAHRAALETFDPDTVIDDLTSLPDLLERL